MEKLRLLFNLKVYFKLWIMTYPVDKGIRPLNNPGKEQKLLSFRDNFYVQRLKDLVLSVFR